MFIRVLKEIQKIDEERELEIMEEAIVISSHNGQPKTVPIRLLENIELDDDIEEAQNMLFSYQGENYEIPLPQKGTPDWYQVLEIIDSE